LQYLPNLSKQLLAQIVLLQQAAKLQQRGAVRHTFASQVDAHEK